MAISGMCRASGMIPGMIPMNVSMRYWSEPTPMALVTDESHHSVNMNHT